MKVRSRRSSRKRKIVEAITVVVLLLFIGMLLPGIITGVSRIVLYPVTATQTWFANSTAVFPMYIRDRSQLIDQITALKNDLSLAESTNLTQQRLIEENRWLRGLLNAEEGERIAAAVMARPNELPYDLLQIDKGYSDGVTVGAPVYVGVDNVIGVIVHTAARFSFAELFTSPNFEATAFVSGPDVVATVEGYGGGTARVRVPQGVPISVGNIVHVPSIEPGVLGRISFIENQPSQPEQYGYITFDQALNSIHFVAVGTESLAPTTPAAISESVSQIIAESVKVDITSLTNVSTTTGEVIGDITEEENE